MKNLIIALFAALVLTGCSKDYFLQTSFSPGYSTQKPLRVLVLPVAIRTTKTTAIDELSRRTDQFLQAKVSSIANLQIIDNNNYQREISVRRFGGQTDVSADVMKAAALASGADAILISDVTTEAVEGGLPLMAFVQLKDLKTDQVLYSGRARATKIKSLEAGVEYTLGVALNELINKK
jgi:hypothetical protein